MMKIIGQLKDVQAFSIEKGIELIHFKNNSILLNNEYLTENAPYYSFSDNYIFLTKSDNSIIKYDFKKKIMLSHDDSYYPVGDTKNNEYLRSSDDEYDKNNNCFWGKTNIISKDTNKIIFTTKNKYTFWNSIWLGDNYIYTSPLNRGILNNLEIKTETTLWQYAITDLGAEKVSKILGVFGQTLVVVGQISEHTYMLIGLDVQSGQLLWKHDKVFDSDPLAGREVPVGLVLPFADAITGRIIIFEAGHYIEIDAESGAIIKWIEVFKAPFAFNDMKMDAWHFDISQADQDYIYFRNNITGAGILNRNTNQLEFLEEIKDDKGKPIMIGPLKIQATKEKFYVLDNQNTLHIYERE